MPDQRRLIHFSGNVQGVGFRYTAMRVAGAYEVTGYVKNLPDGRVEVLAEGEPEQIDCFVQAVRGRMGHYIDHLSQQPGPASGKFRGFDIRF